MIYLFSFNFTHSVVKLEQKFRSSPSHFINPLFDYISLMAWPWTHRTLQWWPLVWGVPPILAFPFPLSSWLPLPPQSASCLSPLQQNKIRLTLAYLPFPGNLKLRVLGVGIGLTANSSWGWRFCVFFSASFYKVLNTSWSSGHEKIPRSQLNIPLSILYRGGQPDPKTIWETALSKVPSHLVTIEEVETKAKSLDL